MERVILVPDMHCGHCVQRITSALSNAGLDFKVSLEEKTVTINGCENCLKTAMEEIYDLGFTPEAK